MRFIHIADIHLGMKPDKEFPWSEAREREIKDTFYKVLEVCNKDNIDFLFIAGDLFHKRPLLRELKEINYEFSKLERTKVVIIAGNHDYIGENSYYRGFLWCNQVTMIDNQEMEKVSYPEEKVHIYGFSYQHRDVTDKPYMNIVPEDKDGTNILLIHGGDEKNVPIDKNHIRQLGYDYVALGHIHKQEYIADNIAYPGSLEPLNKNETGKHGYIYGEFDQYGTALTRFVPCSKREYIHLTVDITPDMTNGQLYDKVRDTIYSNGEDNIYKIIIRGKREPDMIVDERGVYKLGNVIQVEDESIPDYDFNILAAENKGNIIGMYIQEIYNKDIEEEILDKALYYGIEALLRVKE